MVAIPVERGSRLGRLSYAAVALLWLLTDCIAVGYPSLRGAFIWPGGFGLREQ